MAAPGNTVSALCNPEDLLPGQHLVDGRTIQVLLFPQQTQYALTALAGGGAAGATPLAPGINEVPTVVTGGDSCILPFALAGLTVIVINNGSGASLSVFPQQANPNNSGGGADTIVPLGGGTTASSSVTNNTTAAFRCYKPGFWKANV